MINPIPLMRSLPASFPRLVSVSNLPVSICFLICILVETAVSTARAQCNTWQPGDGLRGFNDTVSATVLWNRGGGQPAILVAAGRFTIAGTNFVSGIAYWDGASWQPVGAVIRSSVQGEIDSLAVLPNGNLVAGGAFNMAGGISATNIAGFDGTNWYALGQGIGTATNAATVYALAVLPTGDLVAGGSFQTAGGVSSTNIALWDGSTWSALGDGSMGGSSSAVYAMAVATNGDLFVTGAFASIGGVPAAGVARWDGASWSPLGAGASANCIAIMPNGDVVVGASRWNGSTWATMNSGLFNVQEINALAVLPDGTLVIGGQFNVSGAPASASVAYWTGLTWTPFGAGADNSVNALTVLGTNSFVASGAFLSAGGHHAARIARWDGVHWNFYGSGFSPGSINAFVRMPNGDIIAGGSFIGAGTVEATNVARWNGHSWSPLGLSVNGPVSALTLLTNGNLVIGGTFSVVNGFTANNLAQWDGSNWSVVGAGTDGGVDSLAVMTNGNLVAGGNFSNAGGTNAIGVARWDGTTWFPMGAGLTTTYALKVMPNGTLFAGGGFLYSGSSNLNFIAQWDGEEWISVSGGINGYVAALGAAANGDLLAGGDFAIAGLGGGGAYAERIARWDGNRWWGFGSGLGPVGFPVVESIAVLADGTIFVGGNLPGGNLAVWDGLAWEVSRGARGGPVLALLALPDGGFVAGGSFAAITGNIISYCFSHWGCAAPVPVLTGIVAGPLGPKFSFQGATGWAYRIEYSTNLQQWVTIKSGLSGAVNFEETDPGRGALPHRYYRVAQE
jgi:hypothetical protein